MTSVCSLWVIFLLISEKRFRKNFYKFQLFHTVSKSYGKVSKFMEILKVFIFSVWDFLHQKSSISRPRSLITLIYIKIGVRPGTSSQFRKLKILSENKLSRGKQILSKIRKIRPHLNRVNREKPRKPCQFGIF